MSRNVRGILPWVLIVLAPLVRAQEPQEQQKTVADVLAAYRLALGSADQVDTLGAESTMFMATDRMAGVRTWWGPKGEWMREFRPTPVGQRRDYFGPDGAFVISGRSRARYRGEDRRTRAFYYVAKALADPFPLLGFARAANAQARLTLGAATGYDVLALPADSNGVRALYLLDQKTGLLSGVRFELEANKPFAAIQFESYAKVAVGDGHVVLPYGVFIEMTLPIEMEGPREADGSPLTVRERIDKWVCNPPDLPQQLGPPPLPADLPAGFLRASFATGPEPSDLAVGDLDGDGRNDIAVACLGGLYIHFGGAEATPVHVKLGTGTHRGCQIVDFDLDGRLDVLTMSWVNPGETLFLVAFDNQRTPTTRNVYAAPSFGYDLAVADFDLDGLPDYVATGFGSRNVTWKFGNGAGGIRFVGTAWPLVKNGRNPERGFGVAVGDLNGDGIRDVAVAEPGRPRVVLFEGQPNLAFSPIAALDEANVGLARPVDVHFFDLDGDGRDELVVAQDHPNNEIEGDLGVFLNKGKSFQALYLAAGKRVQCVRSGDIDGDGRIDLVAASYGTDQIAWLRSAGDNKFDEPRFFGAGRGPTRLVVADVDRDERLDLVAANNLDDTICVIRNQGSKQVAPGVPAGTVAVEAFVPGEFRLKGLADEYEFMGEWRLPLSITDPSGLTFLHGDAVHTGLAFVSDKQRAIFRATVDRATRRLLVAPAIPLRGVPDEDIDFEGVAFDHGSGTLFIGCERDSSVIRSTLFGGLLGRTVSDIDHGDNHGIEAVALRRLADGTPLLYLFKQTAGSEGEQPPVHVYDIQESPFKLTRRGEPLRLPAALANQTGAAVSDEHLFVVARFARSIAEFTFDGDGVAEAYKLASYLPLTQTMLGYPAPPKSGLIEGIARAENGDLFLLADNNREEIGLAGKNRGAEGRLIWLRNASVHVAKQAASRVRLRLITVPLKGAKGAPADALDPAAARALAIELKQRILAGDDPAALVRERKLARGPFPPAFWLVRPPGVRNGADLGLNDLPLALNRLGFSLAVGEVGVCEYDATESPFGYAVLQRVE